MMLKPWVLLVIGLLGADSLVEAKIHDPQAKQCKVGQNPMLTVDDSKWPGYYCQCGLQQSPVNIKTSDVILANKEPFRFYGFQQDSDSFEVSNSGLYVKVKLKFKKTVKISGGILGNHMFIFNHFHFHWDKNDSEGSEHQIDGKRSAMEGHFVFFKQGVMDPDNTKGAVAVLTVLYDLSKKKNNLLQPMVKVLKSGNLENPHDAVSKTKKKYQLRHFLPHDKTKYYTYKGSLSTPNCTEGTQFIIFKEKLRVNKNQVKVFRLIKNAKGKRIKDNCRPTKLLSGRKVIEVRHCTYNKTMSSECHALLQQGTA